MTAKPRYLSIQYLRAIAALMVVFHHLRDPKPWLYNPFENFSFGAYGVEIFFVISGFVIYTAARQEPVGEFVRRRIIRVVPLYWLATAGYIAIDAVSHGVAYQAASLETIVKSFLFIPHFHPLLTDQVLPYLIPGWSLNYEMFFYALFAVTAAFGAYRLGILLVLLVLLVALGALLSPLHSPLALTYTNPLILLFGAGLLIAYGERLGRLPKAAALLLFISAPAVLAIDWLSGSMLHLLPAIGLTLGFVALEHHRRLGEVRLLRLIGDASYAIYLSHFLIIRIVVVLVQHLPLSGPPQFIILLATGLAGSIVFGIAVHLLVEKPLIRLFNRRLLRKRQLPA
ncbi:hypothetical protein BJF92_01840 [Rhizobium rhizosphaerae]|uniref:Acyltransferase 3 domain-containing protein n=1 Tax=Xaviernesmea rhizosphaerae TaxID=1672749 RepID=A0A1Q9AKN4_9HYPH|nr:acyltransferase [Xaviernesmea rhizosphaerae]OLP55878.1 hypothetical protein BJF92_01840 [Xaviernesmea rhizosphaerae]